MFYEQQQQEKLRKKKVIRILFLTNKATNALVSQSPLQKGDRFLRSSQGVLVCYFFFLLRYFVFLFICFHLNHNFFSCKSSNLLILCLLNFLFDAGHMNVSFSRSFLRFHIWFFKLTFCFFAHLLPRASASSAFIASIFCYCFWFAFKKFSQPVSYQSDFLAVVVGMAYILS